MEKPSLQELISSCGMETRHLNRQCPREVTIKIADEIVDWKMLGCVLGLQRQKLQAIDREYQTEDQRKVAMFDEWKSINGSRASYLKLAEALYGRNRVNIVEQLLDLLKQSMCCETTPAEFGTAIFTLPDEQQAGAGM